MIAKTGFRTRIALPFIITAIALIFVGLFSVNTSRNLISDTDNIATLYLPAISKVINGDRDLYQALVAQMAYVDASLRGEASNELLTDFNDNVEQARTRFNQAVSGLDGVGIRSAAQGFDSAFEQWEKTARRVLDLARTGNPEQARMLATREAAPLFSQLRDYFDRIGSHIDDLAQQRATEASSEGVTSTTIILITTLLALLLSVVLFFVFMRLIVGSISALREQLDNIAKGEGDLTQRIPAESDDDLGRLANSFNRVLANLQQMIGAIQGLSRDLGQESGQLSVAAQDNDAGVSRQTDAIAMVDTAINEMQSAIEEVAGNASHAAELTRDADETGQRSADIIHKSSAQVRKLAEQTAKAVASIRILAENSNEISGVLDVIRDVADQTNLLALNAAIEAARAGDQGRGFAVVADEVRTLALRTQESTENIQSMISRLQSGVADVVGVMETGSKEASATETLSNSAEAELQSILQATAHITDVNTSVASATEEQTQVIDEINRNITEINDLAAAGAQRSSDIGNISRSLDGYAQQLQQQTGRFKV
ncbi:MAG: methyl-accepting chemotaxis protein [Oceanospirillales bacterium]|nr:methyl-accepting chemotaxis protein [Oceanospirillales bacterium]